ncbi:hypothetical protein BGZ65_005743, partial [Modicella reniformis]
MLPPAQDCKGFVAAEGLYELLQDIFLDQVPAHPVIPTYVSSVSVKYKDYLNSSGNGTHSSAGSDIHGMIAALNLEQVDEHLKDLKVTEERAADDEMSGYLAGNFHGNLVDLPLFSDGNSSSGSKNPKGGGGIMSPGPPQVMTPGPPPLKDSTHTKDINHSFTTKSLGRSATFPLQHPAQFVLDEITGMNQGLSSNATIGPSSAASAGFTSFFSGKRKKPKSNIAKTNSTFVTKIITNENLAKILANREPLSHISFSKAFPTSHDVNILTRSCDHLDVIIGFSTGDIIWFNPLSNKYSRLNKQ